MFINYIDPVLIDEDLLNVFQRTTTPIELLENLQKKRSRLKFADLTLIKSLQTEKYIFKYSFKFNELSINVTNNLNNTQLII